MPPAARSKQVVEYENDMSSPIIETRSLSRHFKQTKAVCSLDLEIQPGELFGLVGPDGAGKTTTLRPEGSAKIAGFDLARQSEAIKPHIGYMAQQFSLYDELSVIENLTFFSDLYNIEPATIPQRMTRLLEFAGLTEFQHRRAAQLSGGMQKKLALACTLLHQPEILLLDEPTTGVDPVSRREFWNILTELHLEGTTIVVSTPYMDEADRCSRVGLMYAGRLVRCAPPHEIRSQITGELIEIHPENWQIARELVTKLPGVLEVQTYGDLLHILVDSADKRLPQIKKALRKNGINCKTARRAQARMEEAFISLIKQMEG